MTIQVNPCMAVVEACIVATGCVMDRLYYWMISASSKLNYCPCRRVAIDPGRGAGGKHSPFAPALRGVDVPASSTSVRERSTACS